MSITVTLPTSPNNGDPVVWEGEIQDALTTFRDYYNRINVADVTTGSLRTEHLVRPRMAVDFDGEARLIAPMSYGLLENDGVDPTTWAIRQRRMTISPSKYAAGEVWRIPLGRTIRLAAEAIVEFDCTFAYQVRGLTSGPIYPDGAGAGSVGGFLSLRAYERSTATETEFPVTRNTVYPMEPFGFFQSSAKMHLRRTAFAAGAWDFYIGYARNGGPITLAQIDISRFVGKIEAHM